MTPEEELKKALVEKELLEHYEKVMESMVKWCMYNQPEDISAVAMAFGIDLPKLTLTALKSTLERWESNGSKDLR